MHAIDLQFMAGFMFMNSHGDMARNEGAAMDRMYRMQRHFYDFSRRYYLLGRDQLLDDLNAKPGQSILEIGCGTGRNLIETYKRFPKCNLYGVDISNEMLKTAAHSLRRAGIQQQVIISQADATNFDSIAILKKKTFNRIYFSYTLSIVPRWQMALRHAVALLTKNGELHVVDFGQCEKWPFLMKAFLFKWLALFHVSPRENLQTALQQLAQEFDCVLVTKLSFGGYVWSFNLRKV